MSQEDMKKKKSVTISPHLALTSLEHQSGAANGRNVSLLMKADIESLTPSQVELLKSIVGEDIDIEKTSYSGMRKKLDNKVREQYQGNDDWDWAYVEDFDDTHVVFSSSDGLQAVAYSVEGGDVVLGTDAYPVNRIISYEEESGLLVMSESVDGVDMNILALVEKSFERISNDERLKSVYKSKQEKGKLEMEQQISKAVSEALAPVQEQLEKANADLQKAQSDLEAVSAENASLKEALDTVEKSAQEAKEAQRLNKLKEVIADEEQAEELNKSLAVLEDEAFDKVVSTYKAKNDVVKGTHLFKQMSTSDKAEGEQDSGVAQLLKARYNKDK